MIKNETLFLLLGIPTWTLVNGIWTCLSQLADNLPEGYSISAFLLLFLTLGNFSPLVLSGILYQFTMYEIKIIISIILCIGFLSGIFIAFFWDYPVKVFGIESSLPLFILFFVIGCCSSSSSVTHFTFVSIFPPSCTTYITFGMGIGSMIAGMLSLIQKYFYHRAETLSTTDYFTLGIVFFILSMSYLPALWALYKINEQEFSKKISEPEPSFAPNPSDNSNRNKPPSSTNDGDMISPPPSYQSDISSVESADTQHQSQSNSDTASSASSSSFLFGFSSSSSSSSLSFRGGGGGGADSGSAEESQSLLSEMKGLAEALPEESLYSEQDFKDEFSWALYVFMLTSGLGHGIVPALISSVCGKFSHSSLTLLLSTSLAALADPFFRYLVTHYRLQTRDEIFLVTGLISLLAVFLLVLALTPSSLSWIFSSAMFESLVIAGYVTFISLFVFNNSCVFLYLKDQVPPSCIHHAYRWGGIYSQLGAMLGCLVAFSLVVSGLTSASQASE